MISCLKPGVRLMLVLPDHVVLRSRVREAGIDGSLLVTYSGAFPLVRGAGIEAEIVVGETRLIYFLQVKRDSMLDAPYLMLQRCVGTGTNRGRSFWRIPFDSLSAIRSARERHFRSATFRDLSITAARLVSECPYPLKSIVLVRLTLPTCEEETIEGRVIRVSAAPVCQDAYGQELYDVVIQFISMTPLMRRQLTHFLWSRLRSLYPAEMKAFYCPNERSRNAHRPLQPPSDLSPNKIE